MGKYFLAIILTFIIITIYYLYMYNINKQSPTNPALPTISQTPTNNQKNCENNKGKWIAKYHECEGLSLAMCEKYGMEYFSCASPCRHNPSAQVCIQMCVEVCKFK